MVVLGRRLFTKASDGGSESLTHLMSGWRKMGAAFDSHACALLAPLRREAFGCAGMPYHAHDPAFNLLMCPICDASLQNNPHVEAPGRTGPIAPLTHLYSPSHVLH